MRTLISALFVVSIASTLTACERCAGYSSDPLVYVDVMDEAGEPIADASVDIDGVPCDESVAGSFSCNGFSDLGAILLTVRADGYKPLVDTVQLETFGDDLCPYSTWPEPDEVVLVAAE